MNHTIAYFKLSGKQKVGCNFESKYVSPLPQYFNIANWEKWGVCVLSCDLNFKSKSINTFVKVYLDEASSEIELNEDRRILCDVITKNGKGILETETERYLSFSNSGISNLSFTFKDENNQNIELEDCSNFLKLKFSVLDNNKMEHFIRLSTTNNERKNEISVNLPHHINLSRNGVWKMALSSAFLYFSDTENRYFMEVKHNRETYVFLFTEEMMQNIDEIIYKVMNDIHNLKNWSAYDFDM